MERPAIPSKCTNPLVSRMLFVLGILISPCTNADSTNQAPVVVACSDRSTSLPDPIWLTATATDDGLPAGSELSLQWSKADGPGSVVFSNPAAAYTYASFSTQGEYVLRFTANDGELSASDDVTVRVGSYGNVAPYISMSYQTSAIVLPQAAVLVATVTDDGIPGTGTISITWSTIEGPGAVIFSDAHATNTTASFSIDGFYTLRLIASDGELQDYIERTIYVDPAYASNRLPLLNKELTGAGGAPDEWSSWGVDNHDPDTDTFRSPSNAWSFTGDGGLYQELSVGGLNAGFVLGFGGHLLTPSSDPLRNGTKHGSIELEFYNGATLLSSASAPSIIQGSPQDEWLDMQGLANVPSNATTVMLRVFCADAEVGDGRFVADDLFLGYGATMVDSGVISNHCALAVVAGRPAAVYKRDGELIFAINGAEDGSGSWATSLIETNGTWMYPSLAIVNGRPSVAYRNSTGNLKFAINGAADGLGSWSVQALQDGGGGVRPSLVEVDGRPALCALETWDVCNVKWCNPHQAIKFYINSAADGSGTWTITTVTNGWRDSYNSVYNDISDCTMAVVDGRPAIAYNQGVRGIWFTINSSAEGTGYWNAVMISTNTYPHLISMAVVAGKPVVACSRYYSSYPRGLYVVASSTVDGSGPWTSSLVGEEDNVRWHTLADIDGKPAIAFARGGSGQNTALYYTKNSTSDASGAWSRYDMLVDVKKGENGALAQVAGEPAILYGDRNGAIRYLGGRNGTAWVDSDEDGMCDNDEERAGTSPFDSSSLLDIMSVAREGADARIQWRGGTRVAQYLDYRTNLFSGSWVCLYSNLPPMSATNVLSLPNDDMEGYYRIRIKP